MHPCKQSKPMSWHMSAPKRSCVNSHSPFARRTHPCEAVLYHRINLPIQNIFPAFINLLLTFYLPARIQKRDHIAVIPPFIPDTNHTSFPEALFYSAPIWSETAPLEPACLRSLPLPLNWESSWH